MRSGLLPRNAWLAALFAVLFSCLPAAELPAQANDPTPPQPRDIRVGMLAYEGEDAALARWSGTMGYMKARLPDLRFTLIPLTLDGMAAALEAGALDIVFTNPGHYALSRDTYRLSPLATLRSDRPGGARTGNRFGAVIFARGDDPALRTLADLKGKRFAAVAPEAFGGYLIGADTLRRNGLDPEQDLGQLSFVGFPQTSIIDAVLSGAADAGTVRTGLIEARIADGSLAPEALRILNPLNVPGFELWLSTALVPEWTAAATPRLPDRLRRRIAIALLSMDPADPAAVTGGYGGWTTPMNDSAVRQILDQTLFAGAAPVADRTALFLLPLLGLALLIALTQALRLRQRAGAAEAPLSADGGVQDTTEQANPVQLTPREREVLSLIEQGQTTKEIARALAISPKTVEYHRGHILQKFSAATMAEVVHLDRGNSGENST